MQKLQLDRSSFRLNKWYLDCVSDAGNTAIGYSATLSWKSLKISYDSYLKTDSQNSRGGKSSLLNCRQPELSADGVIWNSKGISCRGIWRPIQKKSFSPVTLYENGMGSVKWDCLQSLSEVHLNIGQEEYAGLGYVERLDMTLAPWQLPIKELHWGRFLSQDCSLIWIQWRGPHPLTLVCLNGEKFEMAEVSTSHVSWDSGRLDISNPVVLRNGPIVKTALSQIPGVRRLFPESILLMDECKWRSRGELEQGGGTCTGWVIHEVIHFG